MGFLGPDSAFRESPRCVSGGPRNVIQGVPCNVLEEMPVTRLGVPVARFMRPVQRVSGNSCGVFPAVLQPVPQILVTCSCEYP